MFNHYKTLGVQDFAVSEEIKKAYRKLSRKFHPDVNNGDSFFEERFKEIQNAYECLNDQSRRSEHDEKLRQYYNILNNKFRSTSEQDTTGAQAKTKYSPPQPSYQPKSYVPEALSVKESVLYTIGGAVLIMFLIGAAVSSDDTSHNESLNTNLVDTTEVMTDNITGAGVDTASDYYSTVEADNLPLKISDLPAEVNLDSLIGESPLDKYRKEHTSVDISLLKILNESESRNTYSGYFTIGSTKEEVLKIQGTPDEVHKYESFKEEVWNYGYSSITFKNGKVAEFSNDYKNLKIKM
ncbi:J domain-containing protein [Pontibacter sp. H259]|uniref:J domain-containing protein n=1 Tax=Pontibacter sp. H259 TaxID=3133421 RepID=UPI0030BDE079